MCLNPQYVPNKGLNKGDYASEKGVLVRVPSELKSKKTLRQVPCGKCPECRASYFNGIKQRAIIESMSSILLFITLTVDNDHIDEVEVDGEIYKYVSYEHIKNMFKRLRDCKEFNELIGYRDFRYLVVQEYGDTTHRPHYHLIIFVAKKDTDNSSTRHIIEKAFQEYILKYWSVNKGTRKHPIYECLCKVNKPYYRNGKLRTNYYCQLVKNNDINSVFDKQDDNEETYIKTVQYLMGYINKPDSYSWKIQKMLDRYKEKDYELYKELNKKLKCKLQFSKGFGCGFTEKGYKFYMEKISVRCSSNTYLYTELCDNLPESYEDFKISYPELDEQLEEWLEDNPYSKYSNWNKFLNSISAEDYMLHMIYLKYFNKEFSLIYKTFFNKVKNNSIGYIYNVNNMDYRYQHQKVRTSEVVESKLYKYIRNMVDESLRAGIPYIGFKIVSSQRFVPMCKFYKDRVTTLDDTLNLYKKLGVKNYDEYIDLFNKYMSNRKALEQQSNIVKHYNEDIVSSESIGQNLVNSEEIYSKFLWNK